MEKQCKIQWAPALLALTLLLLTASLSSIQQAHAVDVPLAEAIQETPPIPCYGSCIISNISSTKVLIGETVTVMGEICPPAENITVRVVFTRPNYSWIDRYVIADNVTGEFTLSQELDMAGFWNIFPVYGHINDRLYVVVTDPNADPSAPTPIPNFVAPFKLNFTVIVVGVILLSVGIVSATWASRRKTRKISSVRLFIQIAFVLILFFGVFIDHQNMPWPAEQIAPHEYLIGADSLSVLPDGLPLPVFGCWFPCGRTFTCPLWQLQIYIYPFWNVGHGFGVDYDISGLERIAIVVGVVVVASILLGRFWCGWICPFGLFLDVVTRIRKALKIKHRNLSPGFNEKFHQLSYIILALIIIISVIFASQAMAGTQLVPGTEQGGFIYTYFSAPFCQVCPMKPLCMLTDVSLGVMQPDWVFSPTTGQFLQLGQYVTSLNVAILILVVAAAFFFRRSWCRICPLGALIALFNRFPPFKWISAVRLEKTEENCTKCGVCKRVCPTQVSEVYEKKGGDVATSQCLLCLRCVEMCPEKDCLEFKFAGKTLCKSRNWTEKP